jgi:alpha-D-xyloside xylohydrolase
MKFTDGYWLIKNGIDANFAIQAMETETDGDSLKIYATVKPTHSRGDTVNATILTVRYSSPMKNIIRVRLSHFDGANSPGPDFALARDADFSPVIEDLPEAAILQAGNLSVRIAKGAAWNVSFLTDGKTLTKSETKSAGYMVDESFRSFMKDELALGVGECVYGLGERFTAFVKNGQCVDMWNADGGTASEQTYKNIPFYLTNRGYGVFVNDPGKVSFEVASEKVSRVQFSVAGESLEYFVIYGPTPKEILERYTALTGRPALPPKWSFGLWLTTSFTTDYDEKTVMGFIDGMIERKIPLSVFHFDCFWMRGFHWCDFVWDPATFPDPAGMLRRIKEKGVRVCVWINPYIAQRSALFAEGKEKGYLLRKTDGSAWQTDQWQAGMGIVDFTNSDAADWYAAKLETLLDMGVDCFKTDFGERIPTDVVWHSGGDPERMHNYYTFLYNKAAFDLLERKRGKGEACLFARSATVGGQKFPAHWGGDCESTFESMAETLRGGLSLGLSGFGFWSHDIGGFEGTPRADLFKRWLAFGLLSSHSRLHGSSSYRVPWNIDEESVAVARRFTEIKFSLMPYLWRLANEAHERGLPVMRAMLLEFPDDPACASLDRQYMLGDSLLVAPVFSADNRVEYYLPAGNWTHFIDGRVVAGGRWMTETYDFMSLPLWVREGAVIPTEAVSDRATV